MTTLDTLWSALQDARSAYRLAVPLITHQDAPMVWPAGSRLAELHRAYTLASDAYWESREAKILHF